MTAFDSIDDLMTAVLPILPEATFEPDGDGQIVIFTNLTLDADNHVVAYEDPDADDGERQCSACGEYYNLEEVGETDDTDPGVCMKLTCQATVDPDYARELAAAAGVPFPNTED